MMSTFNATSHRAFGDDMIDPIIRSCSRKRPHEIDNSISGDSTNHHTSNHPSATKQHNQQQHNQQQQQQQQRGGYCHAYSHQQQPTSGTNKRQRQNRDELQYAAATIQKALADAGRPAANVAEFSSPRQDGVDMDGCKVLTAREFDEQFDCDRRGAGTRSDAEYDDCDDYNLASMYMIAGLVQSTRHHYDFSSKDDEAAAGSGNAAGPSYLLPIKKQSKSASGKEEAYGISASACDENSSEVLSSWTPSSGSFNHLNYYNSGKNGSNIDNDNRSDGLSSDMTGEEGGDSSSSSSSSSSSYAYSSENGDDVDESSRRTKTEDKDNQGDFDGPYSVIG